MYSISSSIYPIFTLLRSISVCFIYFLSFSIHEYNHQDLFLYLNVVVKVILSVSVSIQPELQKKMLECVFIYTKNLVNAICQFSFSETIERTIILKLLKNIRHLTVQDSYVCVISFSDPLTHKMKGTEERNNLLHCDIGIFFHLEQLDFYEKWQEVLSSL